MRSETWSLIRLVYRKKVPSLTPSSNLQMHKILTHTSTNDYVSLSGSPPHTFPHSNYSWNMLIFTVLLESKLKNTETLNALILELEAAWFTLIAKYAIKWLVICFPFFKNKLKAGDVCLLLFITCDNCSHSKNHDAIAPSTVLLGTSKTPTVL